MKNRSVNYDTKKFYTPPYYTFINLCICLYLCSCRFGGDDSSNDILMNDMTNPNLELDASYVLYQDQYVVDQDQMLVQDFMISRDHSSCEGAWMCQEQQACVDGVCQDLCQHTQQCPRELSCVSSDQSNTMHCGNCETDEQCQGQAQCFNGFCLPPTQWIKIHVNQQLWRNLTANPYQSTRIPCQIELLAQGQEALAVLSEDLGLDDLPSRFTKQQCELNIHGGSSRDYSKYSLKIHLNQEYPNVSWGKKMILRAEYNDKTYIRNQLSHWLFRTASQIPVPRTKYTWVQVNDQMMGLYVSVERINDNYLEHWGRSSDTLLFEADPPNTHSSLGISSLVQLNTAEEYILGYDLKHGYGWYPLIKWIEDDLHQDHLRWLDGDTRMVNLRSSLFWKEYIDYLILMSLIQNRDYVRKNYYLSMQYDVYGKQRWEIYPWDLDLSWGCIYNEEAGDTLCDTLASDFPMIAGMLPPNTASSYPTDGFYNLLIHLAISQPKAETYFKQRVCDLIVSNVWNADLARMQESLLSQISPWIQYDQKDRIDSLSDVQQALADLNHFKEIRTALMSEYADCHLNP